MNGDSASPSRQIREEHDALDAEVKEVQGMLDALPAAPADSTLPEVLARRLDALRPRLARHFAREEEIGFFRKLLLAAGVPVVRRYSGGTEIGAACGTLAGTRAGGEVLKTP